MRLRIQTRKEFSNNDGFYYQIDEIEIESFRWNKNHEFQYVAKNSCIWSKLEPNQEIVGLGI